MPIFFFLERLFFTPSPSHSRAFLVLAHEIVYREYDHFSFRARVVQELTDASNEKPESWAFI